jgi:polar amino acid transport system substrate-binding protein
MKKGIIVSILMAAAIIASIALSGCTEEEVNKIIVGTSADFPPFEYVDENQNIVGFDIDAIKSILTDQGYTVEVQDISFDSLIASLQAGKIDVIAAGMSITDEREEQIDFSDPYYEADQSILINADSGIIINDIEDLINLTMGAQTGTTGAAWMDDYYLERADNDSLDPNPLKRYETYTLAILDLENENLDAIILDKPVALAFEELHDFEVALTIITDENYGFGVKEGNTELLNDINDGLEKLQSSDDWNDLITKYFE